MTRNLRTFRKLSCHFAHGSFIVPLGHTTNPRLPGAEGDRIGKESEGEGGGAGAW